MTDERLIELIYAGLTDPAHWQTFLDGFRERLRAGHGMLLIAHVQHNSYSLAVTSGIRPGVYDELMRWNDRDPWAQRIDWSTAFPGQFRASHEICPDEILESTEMYREFLGPLDWHYGGGLLLAASPAQKALLSSLRSKELGPLNADEVAFHHRLSPHWVRAMAIHEERLRLRTEQAATRALLDSSPDALLLLSQTGEIRVANAAAHVLLEQNELIGAERGYVRARDPESHARLIQAIGRVGAPMGRGGPESLVLANDDTTLWITIGRLTPPGDSPLSTDAPAVVVTLTDPALRPRLVAEPLQRLYGLTPAEAHVALLLADGLAADEVALRTGVVLDTVRTHIKRILSKTRLNRQSELVALVLRVARPPLAPSNGAH
jgi:DNA-binding CsgD family transcriptional regulator/PAS domain-containing protein